jgi:succinate dehydrogenase/fumarate reductase flavoprotein subunit
MAIQTQTIQMDDVQMTVHTLHTLVVGSGAAGLQSADRLCALGVPDVGLLTEGMSMGTSRNTGSDKQTYYKLTLSGAEPDSVQDMARTLFEGGCVHGDIALVQAAQSARCFLRLCDIGVPFPQNRLGEYAGYQTDHDRRRRATSAGPLTSRYMTERLEAQVRKQPVRIFDRFLAIGIVTMSDAPMQEAAPAGNASAVGLVALDVSRLAEPGHGLTLFHCTNLVWATGGPAGIYRYSVYPESQTGATGIALEAGAVACNLTESQYGIASTGFRWNLSGTFQQVLPRYVSTDANGENERDFLMDWFDSPGPMLDAIFLKGYQWPFDPAKTGPGGSSVIDLLVGMEAAKGRRVFLDFRQDPCPDFDFALLGSEAHDYLARSGALFGKPIDRLWHMNPPAIALYADHGIDLASERLEIAVCAQHNNGGLVGDLWWESNLRHFFPVGEVNGSFGVHRPGGSALNATQVGGLRAAERIAARYRMAPVPLEQFLEAAKPLVRSRLAEARSLLEPSGAEPPRMSVEALRLQAGTRMSEVGAHIRPVAALAAAEAEAAAWLRAFPTLVCCGSPYELPDAFRLRDILLTRYAFLASIREYAAHGGGSRGSSLLAETGGMTSDAVASGDVASGDGKSGTGVSHHTASRLPGGLVVRPETTSLRDWICETSFVPEGGALQPRFRWSPIRAIPEREDWFENVWRDYREGFPDEEEMA